MFTYHKLRVLLRERNISFRKLRADLHITPQLAGHLRNDRPVTIDKLAMVCRYLNVDLSDIVEINVKLADGDSCGNTGD